jgi:hypothetical protein
VLMESIIEPRRPPFCSSLLACEGICTSPSRKGPGRLGYTICLRHTSVRSWCAIRGKMPC